MSDPKPCVDCGRQYGHLDLCRVKELHECLDRTIALYGPKRVSIYITPTTGDEYLEELNG